MTILSASQIETGDLCRRKRFLGWKAKAKVPKSGAQTFGSVLHGVIERFNKVDELGRDKNGKALQLYPYGWNQVAIIEEPVIRDGINDTKTKDILVCDLKPEQIRFVVKVIDLEPWEEAVLKMLFNEATLNGIIERRPNQFVERYFELPLKGGHKVVGYMDIDLPWEVQDNKSTKRPTYLKSAAKIRKDIQMMLYGAAKLLEAQARGEAPPKTIRLTHNQFVKGSSPRDLELGYKPVPPQVKQTPVDVTPADIVEFWNTKIMPLAQQLLADDLLSDPFEIPDPDPEKKACTAYGPCAYLTICRREETVANFKARMALMTQHDRDPRTLQELRMSLADKLKAKIAQNGAPAAAPAGAPVNRPAAATATVAAPAQPAANAAPWALAGCGGCKGTGVNSAGKPCGMCKLKNKAVFDTYAIEIDANGNIVWAGADGSEGTIKIAQTPAPTVVKQAPAPAPAEAAPEDGEDDLPEDPSGAAPEPAQPAITLDTPSGPRRGPGRPPGSKNKAKAPSETGTGQAPVTGLALMVGCVFSRPPVGAVFVMAETLLSQLSLDVVLENGEKQSGNYFTLNVWARRNALWQNSREIAEAMAGQTIIMTTGTPDTNELMAALKPHAETVMHGVHS